MGANEKGGVDIDTRCTSCVSQSSPVSSIVIGIFGADLANGIPQSFHESTVQLCVGTFVCIHPWFTLVVVLNVLKSVSFGEA